MHNTLHRRSAELPAVFMCGWQIYFHNILDNFIRIKVVKFCKILYNSNERLAFALKQTDRWEREYIWTEFRFMFYQQGRI